MTEDDSPEISYVVPAHNSGNVIVDTVRRLQGRLAGVPAEIIVVENGSTDGTWKLLTGLVVSEDPSLPNLRIMRSPKGMGEALRVGVVASLGRRVVLTADDLPFGFDDLDALPSHPDALMIIGSKGHPASAVRRGLARDVLSWGFRTLRFAILRSPVKDPQGTFIVDGTLVRSIAPLARENGFLFTTELVALAEARGVIPVEVPVQLSSAHDEHPSRIHVSDVMDMARGLWRVRRSVRAASSSAPTRKEGEGLRLSSLPRPPIRRSRDS